MTGRLLVNKIKASVIGASGYGGAVASLSGWYAKRFTWARRPLAEAGLNSPS